MPHWNRVRSKPSEQTFATDPITTSVMGGPVDTSAAREQLRHARQQQELQSTYPGREREGELTNVLSITRP
jgi:hypothetical protein